MKKIFFLSCFFVLCASLCGAVTPWRVNSSSGVANVPIVFNSTFTSTNNFIAGTSSLSLYRSLYLYDPTGGTHAMTVEWDNENSQQQISFVGIFTSTITHVRTALDLIPPVEFYDYDTAFDEFPTELTIYGVTSSTDDYHRLNVGWGSGGQTRYAIWQESDGGVGCRPIQFGSADHSNGINRRSIDILGYESSYTLGAFGSVIFGEDAYKNNEADMDYDPIDMIILHPPPLIANGYKDSHSLQFVGNGYDGSNHLAKWNIFADVTDNAGGSQLSIAHQLDSGTKSTGVIVTDGMSLIVTQDDGDTGELDSHLVLRGATNNNETMSLGIDTTNNFVWIQGNEYGGPKYPLMLQPNGGNIGIGMTSTPPEKLSIYQGALAISTQAATASASAGYAKLYSTATAGIAELWALNSNGDHTKLSAHNENGEWVFDSYNSFTGKHTVINMEKAIAALEKLAGESFMEIDELSKPIESEKSFKRIISDEKKRYKNRIKKIKRMRRKGVRGRK